MFNITKKEITWGGRKLTLETGRIARQADGAVLATYGDTAVLCTVVSAKSPKPDIDFFPLTVNYQEKAFAAGKIPGGFFKREGKPSEKEVLTSRLIDRPIRPLFPEGFRNDTQVVCTVLSHDIVNDPDIVAMIGASAALTISGIPFMGPIAGVRVGYIDGEYVLNPAIQELEESDLDLVVAGTASSVLMVESEAAELSEEVMLGAVVFGHNQIKPVLDLIISLAEASAKDPWVLNIAEPDAALVQKVASLVEEPLRAAYAEKVKQARVEKISAAKKAAVAELVTKEAGNGVMVGDLIKKIEEKIVRGNILDHGKRIDGRGPENIRQIVCETGVLPKAHGSALFTRGETQALVVTTLGTSEDEQIIDALEGEYRSHFMLHYNFPPYSVGEATPMRPPGRREIGHGKLAYRAVNAMLPDHEEFPYTLRVVSEITESNGSSSMATVCGTSLALMDAGVPIRSGIAGIAMGLILEDDGRFEVLSDIMGDEDHLGDMDFKVAGTNEGITALQMDIKVAGITPQIMEVALTRAKAGRLHILGEMAKAMTSSREEVNANAPRITTLNIPKDKIREVIGSGGKVIREICETTGAKVDIEDDGTIRVAAVSEESAQAAINWIKGIVEEPELGKIYTGKVVKIMDFGAFVNFMGGRDGLVHISEMAATRVAQVSDVVNEGDVVKVKVLEIDPRGKVRLSMKVVNQETGEDISDQFPPSAPREPRERSDDDRPRRRRNA
ncbi:MAG: polyribonucleotide nucleotidyltransferase [Alphaproteobacteria bacterium]|nr:polyribonucleotide nucleotidyltransferase [Alphaproteobacteria bacterium]